MTHRFVGPLVAALAATFVVISSANAQTPPAVDKVVSIDGQTTSVTTPAFSTTTAAELLLAFVAADGPTTGGQTVTVSGAGLAWGLVKRVNARLGTSEIWAATASSLLTNVTVTSTEGLGGNAQTLTVVAFANAGGVGASATANGASGAPSVSITTTQAGSLVYGVGNDWDNAIARTVGAGQAIVHTYLSPAGDTLWVQNRVSAVTSPSTVQLNDTAPTTDRWNLAAVEIVPPQAPGFLVVPYNDTLTAGLSDTVTYDMLISPYGGYTGALTCSVSAIPPGATGVTEPPGGPPHPGPIAMTVTTGAATPPGTYHPVVTCVSVATPSLSASTTLNLVVESQPDVRVVLQPNSLTLSQGQPGSANFTVQAINGFAQGVNMSATGMPSNVTPAFTPSALIPSGGGTLQLTVGGSVAPGTYPLVITATPTDGSPARSAPFTLTVLQQNAAGTWRQQALGQAPALFYGSIVGDPGNTGKIRVYGSAGNGLMYEYSFDGSSWTFAQMPFGVTADGEMHNGGVGPGHDDGVNRLYIAANLSGRVYEASWINGSWSVSLVATLPGATDAIVGDGRNDGHKRLYVSWQAGVSEFTWSGSAWTQVVLGNTEGGEVHCVDIATGRNDGINRIYTSNDANGQVSEYSWNGTGWTKVLMGTNLDVRNIAFGDGRNDGTMRGYAASADGNVYEYTWNGSAWQNVSIGNAGVAGIKVHSNPIKAKGDNLNRVYAAAADGGIYEYTWNGSIWQTTKLGSATAYMYGLDSGDGLNKGTTQLYGSSYDGEVYLFEWMVAGPPPMVTVPNVVGLPQGSVANALSPVGLIVGTVTNQDSAAAPIGVVIGQLPIAGAQASQGSAVNLVVSAGVAVPNVVLLTQADATAALTAASLTATVSNASSASVPVGSVISQSPIAGVHVSAGAGIAIVISTGPPPPPPPGITVDQTVFSEGSGARTTPAFTTTAAGEVLLAFAASDGPSTGAQTLTVSGAGLTWTLVRRANTRAGTSEIWKATAVTTLTNATVTSTQARTGYRQSLTVVTFKGSSGTGASAVANGASGAPSVTLVTTQAGSLVYGIGNDWDRAVARTLGANQTLVHQFVDTASGDTYWVQARTGAVTNANTSVQLNDTAPTNDRWNFASVEVIK